MNNAHKFMRQLIMIFDGTNKKPNLCAIKIETFQQRRNLISAKTTDSMIINKANIIKDNVFMHSKEGMDSENEGWVAKIFLIFFRKDKNTDYGKS